MKKNCIIIGALLLFFVGCGKAQPSTAPKITAAPEAAAGAPAAELTAAPIAEPTAAPVRVPEDRQAESDEERILGHCLSIVDQLPCSVDLDGDGQAEMVDLVPYVPEDEYPRWALTVTANGQEKRFETGLPCDMPYDLWMGDLDEDGRYELFMHGDMASDDYVIYAWRADLSSILFEPDDRLVRWVEADRGESDVFDGYIDGFEDGHIVIESVVDMLGSHWGVRNFSLGDDGIIGPVSTVWSFNEEDRPLTVAKALTAYRAAVRKDPGEAFTLEAGEKIYPLASDGFSRMWFETEGGKGGVLLLTPDEENMWLIDGTPEADFFETLPYAG